MTRIKICNETGCKDAATTAGFCRRHYLKNWKRLKKDGQKRAAKRLNRYIENVVRRHPDRYLEIIKRDLRSPDFDKNVEECFGNEENDVNDVFNEPTYDEDVRRLIDKLKAGKE